MRLILGYVFGCLLAAGGLWSEGKKEPRYFFYKATRNEATFYLLGSMHMGKPSDPDYPEKIYKALRGSSMLILEGEVRREKMRQPDMTLTYLPAKKKVTDLLTADERTRLKKMTDTLGVPMGQFEHFQPWFIEFMFGYRLAYNQGYVLEYGTEHRLLRYVDRQLPAKERPRIFTLERFDEVIVNMSRLPLADQMKRFRAFLSYSDRVGESNALEMAEHWRNGDDAKVLDIFHYYNKQNASASDAYAKVLLFDRNRRMAERLDLVARYPGQYFVISGALHLIGEKNILDYLRSAGFTVERL
ncbi:MAG: TraB/GumN family protein [Spirochaetota bacterium]